MEGIEANGKEARMSEERRNNEIARRQAAQDHAGEVVSGSGKRGKPGRMAQMVSVRVDGELASTLRTIAAQRGVTVSDLLRGGAELIVQNTRAAAQPRIRYTVTGAQEALPTRADDGAYAVH